MASSVTAEAIVELRHVNVMRGGRLVLRNVSLRIEHGEQIALLGPNGCGKSTLLKTLTCELYPLADSEMRVSLFGRERWDLTELKKRFGLVDDDLPGQPFLRCTGTEAVLTGFFASSTLWPHFEVTGAMRLRAEALLAEVHAEPLAARLFGEMSAGQQRRILIARALAGSAGCLLLDEPSNALDLAAQRDFRTLLEQLAAAGTTIILVTHHIADIIPAIDRVVFMQAGRIMADGRRDELLTASALSELFATEVSLSERDGYFHAW